MSTIEKHISKDQTVQKVRAAIVAKGSSLHRWCRENGVDTSNARRALSGQWVGKKGTEIKVRILSETGLTE